MLRWAIPNKTSGLQRAPGGPAPSVISASREVKKVTSSSNETRMLQCPWTKEGFLGLRQEVEHGRKK